MSASKNIERHIKRRQERWKKYYERHKEIHYLLKEHGQEILSSDSFKKTADNIQHGDVSVPEHCIEVAKLSLRISRRLPLKIKDKELVRGALLHDYFLYDWHTDDPRNTHRRLHGFYHPGIALRNAEKDFDLTDTEKDIIRKHMWPMTIVPPIHVESWIVTMADKYCSLMETVHLHRGRGIRKYTTLKNRNEDTTR